MSFAKALRCRECGREYPLTPSHVCEFCFGPLEVDLRLRGDARRRSRARASQRGPQSVWRYADLLPVEGEPVDLQAGFTPLIRPKNLGKHLGLNNLYLKNDCANPTWSFKDRVVAVAATQGARVRLQDPRLRIDRQPGERRLAPTPPRAGMEAFVFVPSDLEAGKLLGSKIYGANLVAVDGSYDDVNRLCAELGDKYPWAFVNINVRPYYSEGSQDAGLRGRGAARLARAGPLHRAAGLRLALRQDLEGPARVAKTWASSTSVQTRMSGCQATGCSPIVTAYENKTLNFRPVRPNTIAKSLAIGNPADGYYTLKIMEETNGAGAAVSDDEVVEGIRLLAETEGIFAETAGGVTIAGLQAASCETEQVGTDEAGRRLHHRRRPQDAGSGRGRAAGAAARAGRRSSPSRRRCWSATAANPVSPQ